MQFITWKLGLAFRYVNVYGLLRNVSYVGVSIQLLLDQWCNRQ